MEFELPPGGACRQRPHLRERPTERVWGYETDVDAAGGGRAGAAGVPALRPARARIRPALVQRVPKERTVAFSCRSRSFCPSCGKKKQLLWAEWLRDEVVAEVAHPNVVMMPGGKPAHRRRCAVDRASPPRMARPRFTRSALQVLELGLLVLDDRASSVALELAIRHSEFDRSLIGGTAFVLPSCCDVCVT